MRPASSVPLLALLLLFSGCLGGSPDPEETLPLSDDAQPTVGEPIDIGIPWRVGNHWVQRFYYQDDPENNLGMFDYHVEATDDVGGHPALRVHGSDSQRTYWLRASDGALLKDSDKGQEHTYDPPCTSFLKEPKEGDAVDHACYRMGTKPPNATVPPQSFSTRVLAAEKVSVPSGEYDTHKIESKQGGTTAITEYYAMGACFPARVTIPEGGRTLVLDLIAEECGSGS